MTSLHDRLTDLADSAPESAAPPGVWEQGRRYGRRRRIETAALTLVLLAAVGSLVGALLPQASYDVGPADADASLRLPDRIETPSPWTKGTDEVGPLGPVVALFTAERKSGILPRSDEYLTEAQTAEALGIKVGTVKSQARDALARLRSVVPDLEAIEVSVTGR